MRMDWIVGLLAGFVIGPWTAQAAHGRPVASGKDTTTPSVTKPPLPPQLTVQVEPHGSLHPWTLRLTNSGEQTLTTAEDPALLWLEVSAPQRRKPTVCRLPDSLRPAPKKELRRVELKPGEQLLRNFDPRLYCFSPKEREQLVPGAAIVPHFGWPSPRSNQQEQWVAWQGPASTQPDPNARATRSLTGPAVRLGPGYGSPGTTHTTAPQAERPLSLTLLAGSDATSPRAATATLLIRNHSPEPQTILLRRERMEYRISGPSGSAVCPATTVGPQSARESLTTLRPGGSRRLTTLLFEVCPHHLFAKAGLYQVSAHWKRGYDATEKSRATASQRVQSNNSVLLRIQQDTPVPPSEKLGRILPSSQSTTTTTGEPPRPTQRASSFKNLMKLPQVDAIE